MDPTGSPVIIAGAGPVGLSLALGLAHHGVHAILLDEKQEICPHSRAPAIHARTLEVFKSWGASDRFLDEGEFLDDVRVWQVGAEPPLAEVDLRGLAHHTEFAGILILPQNRTESILLEEVRARGLTDVRFGHRLSGYRQHASGVLVTVRPNEGTAYELETKFLIGCDGARSTVRTQLGWQLEGKTYPTRLMLADVSVSDARRELPWPRVTLVPEGVLAALRLDLDTWRIIATLGPDEGEDAAIAPDAIARRVRILFGPGPFEPRWASTFHIHCRTSPHFRSGRVFLAGDAAHINSPAGGQGMNAGIHDAHNLAWKLARVLRFEAGDALLASYEQERRPVVVESIDRFTDWLTRTVLLPRPHLRAPLARLFKTGMRIPLVSDRILQRAAMLAVHYTASAVLSGDGPLRGARAPDGPLIDHHGRRLRLFDLISREAVLLLFEDERLPRWNLFDVEKLMEGIPELAIARMRPGTAPAESGVYLDTTGQLWGAWGGRSGRAALIRPDGHIGWLANRPTPEALRTGVETALGQSGVQLIQPVRVAMWPEQPTTPEVSR